MQSLGYIFRLSCDSFGVHFSVKLWQFGGKIIGLTVGLPAQSLIGDNRRAAWVLVQPASYVEYHPVQYLVGRKDLNRKQNGVIKKQQMVSIEWLSVRLTIRVSPLFPVSSNASRPFSLRLRTSARRMAVRRTRSSKLPRTFRHWVRGRRVKHKKVRRETLRIENNYAWALIGDKNR